MKLTSHCNGNNNLAGKKFKFTAYPDRPVITGGDEPATENEHYALLCKCSGGKPAATLQWIWGGDKVNSKTWVVEKDDGSVVSYAKLEFLARRVRNNDLFECEATNRAMWIAGAAPYVVSHTLVVHCKYIFWIAVYYWRETVEFYVSHTFIVPFLGLGRQ